MTLQFSVKRHKGDPFRCPPIRFATARSTVLPLLGRQGDLAQSSGAVWY